MDLKGLSPEAIARIKEIASEDREVVTDDLQRAQDEPVRFVFHENCPLRREPGTEVLVTNGFTSEPGLIMRDLGGVWLVEVMDQVHIIVHEAIDAWPDYRETGEPHGKKRPSS